MEGRPPDTGAPASSPLSRQERKERTRAAILASALELSADTGLAGISLRQVAKDVGIVPTAFYRHFDSIEQLGLELVDQSFVTLRAMLREVRVAATVQGMIPSSVDVLIEHVRGQEAHFRFISRERRGGSAAVRRAIGHELRLCERELADDIALVPGVTDTWTKSDLRIISELIVGAMVTTAEKLLSTSADPDAEAEVAHVARTQLRMLVVGALNWKSR